jgi:hypothetical protein
VLERLSDKTGGQAFFEELDKLDEVFDNILADLANQYLFGFVPRDATASGANCASRCPGTTTRSGRARVTARPRSNTAVRATFR